MKISTFWAVFFFVFQTTQIYASELSRRLGFSDNDKILLLHADDMGMTTLGNQAVRDVIGFGIVKSASIMVPAPAARAAIVENPDLDLGIHITLNSEWRGYRWTPISNPHHVLSIVNPFCPKHYMYKGREPIYFFGRTRDIETEVRAQIEEALRLGLKPTHIDTHMAMVLLKKSWATAYLKLALQYRIPPMIVRWTDELKAQLPPLVMNHLKKGSQDAERAGFLLLDYISLGVDGTNFEERKRSFIQQFQKLKPGVTMIFMHPAYFEKGSPFPKDVVRERFADALVMQDPEVKQILQDLGIKLIGWKDIQRVYDWDKITWPPR